MLQKLLSRFRSTENQTPAIAKLKALVLAQDSVVSGLLINALRGEGFEVVSARTASDASLQARRESIDLAFLDTEGYPSIGRTIREIRSLAGPDELTIVVFRQPGSSKTAGSLIAAGADDCLDKPLVFSEVRDRVQARLRGRNRLVSRAQPTELKAGTVLDGKFRLGEELGSGNFGTVYSAFHLNLERQVAIKILHNQFSGRDEVKRRLRREGVSACQIDHPNAVKVFDLSLTGSGEPYLVMELLQGHSLEQELALVPEGKMSLERTARILIPVCRVLAESHRLGMLHLDIKPGNIFLHSQDDGEAVVKVVDFGIVRMVSSEADQESKDQVLTHSFEGTPPYAALERLVAEPFGSKADVYSVGVMLYQMLAGRLPYQEAKNPIHLISLVMEESYPALETVTVDLPADVGRLCRRCLSSNAADRPTASEVAELMQPWTGLEGTGL